MGASFVIAACLAVQAAAQVLPLREVRAGMRGTGHTVFTGERIEQFGVEILGVLENAGPKQAVILARLSGGPLERTGVLQGMSGSPVYVNGKLLGAVALAFSLAKEPIAGIRPFEEMREARTLDRASVPPARCLSLALVDRQACAPAEALTAWAGKPAEIAWGESRLTEIATPVSFSGFTATAIEQFAPELRRLGLEPRQGISGGGGSNLPTGDPASLKPGAMISVQLVSGDLSIGADGTVTHIEGNRLYAFGHRFISLGEVEMPFASAEVLTLLPNLSTSFKISTARKWLGSITEDYSTAVRGELGRSARLIPVSIAVKGGDRSSRYQMQMVQDPALTPFLLQVSAFSALDATERTAGAVSFTVRQNIDFANAPSVRSANVYSGEFNVPLLAAQSVAIPLAYAMQSGFGDLRVKAVDVSIDAIPARRQMQIEDLHVGRRIVRPGEIVPVTILLASEGRSVAHTVTYRVPAGAPTGNLHFTAADALVTNFTEFRQSILLPPRSAVQVSTLLNGLRSNTRAYLRVWRAEPSYSSQGEDLPSPPPSIANLLARSQGVLAFGQQFGSKVAEIEVAPGEVMVTGSRTATVEVRE
ncbi:MAG: hypothetical protein HY235_28430 [Acidobacteria bacterium]|nr:hypothetical protein [Acidobacteriota bacterium]